MPDPNNLHDLTAELHDAVNEPQRWRAAWLALNEFMGRTDPASEGAGVSLSPNDAGAGPCGPGPDRRCFSEGYRILHRSDRTGAPVGTKSGDGHQNVNCYLQETYLAALDALPVAAWLCSENRHLVHANTAGAAELKRQRWFKLEANQICASDRALQQQFVASFAELVAPEARSGSNGQPTIQLQGGAVEVGLRRVAQVDGSPFVLVSVATGMKHDTAAPAGETMAYWPERRLLSPRQRELAGLLLTFHSLDAAADKMGITRRTARDHLAGLFQSTGMRRQQDLINFLRKSSTS